MVSGRQDGGPGSREDRADPHQTGGKGGHMFVSNEKEHYNHSFLKMVAYLVALPLGSLCVGSVIAYKSYRSDQSEVIYKEAKDAYYDRQHTIGEKLVELGTQQATAQGQINQCKRDTDFLFCYINKGKNCDWGQR